MSNAWLRPGCSTFIETFDVNAMMDLAKIRSIVPSRNVRLPDKSIVAACVLRPSAGAHTLRVSMAAFVASSRFRSFVVHSHEGVTVHRHSLLQQRI